MSLSALFHDHCISIGSAPLSSFPTILPYISMCQPPGLFPSPQICQACPHLIIYVYFFPSLQNIWLYIISWLVGTLIIFRYHIKYHLITEVFPGHASQGSYSHLLFYLFTRYPIFITIFRLIFNFIIFLPTILKTVSSMRKACLLEYLQCPEGLAHSRHSVHMLYKI